MSTTAEHVRRLRDACQGIDKHVDGNPAAFTALKDIELSVHELEQAWEDEKLMEQNH